MKQIQRILLAVFIGCSFVSPSKAQVIDSIEYFFNTDPGFGNGTGVNAADAANISNLSFNINTSSLNKGFNNLFVRSHSSNGKWSLSQRWLFFKDILPASNINRLEYFIDTDPGFGNGTAVTITPGANISNVFFTVDITALSRGFHNIFLRSRDDNGNWSVTSKWLFFKDLTPATTVNRLEYFIDTDPGFGKGTAVSITPGANISEVFFTVDVTAQARGFHTIFMRSRDNNGSWSTTNRWLFFKDLAPATTVNRLEYFIDTDPGLGNGTAVTITPGASVPDVFFTVDITALAYGFHNILLRSKDNNGSWSITNRWLFFKERSPTANVSKMEYFVDTDPGFGNGTNIPVTAAASITDLAVAVNTTSLSEGFHKLCIRSRDNNGSWSITNFFGFFKEFKPDPLNIKAGEYFIDTDPGFGNGTAIPFTNPRGNNIADFSFNTDISPLTNAIHYLFVRTLDSNNRWSLTNVVSFTKNGIVPVKWLSFNANLKDKTVLLDWQTANEINSSYFDVERSIDGFRFEKIGQVKAAGNSTTTRYYQFTDPLPVKGMNYYRLKQVDLDGTSSYSEVRKIEIKTDRPLFAIYNNPSDGSALLVKSNASPAILGIFDASGKKLKDIQIQLSSQQLDLSALPSGSYTAVLYKNSGVVAVEQIIIRH